MPLRVGVSILLNIELLPNHAKQAKLSNIWIWVFPKIVVPQNGWFIMENPIKWMIWGYQHVRKPPCSPKLCYVNVISQYWLVTVKVALVTVAITIPEVGGSFGHQLSGKKTTQNTRRNWSLLQKKMHRKFHVIWSGQITIFHQPRFPFYSLHFGGPSHARSRPNLTRSDGLTTPNCMKDLELICKSNPSSRLISSLTNLTMCPKNQNSHWPF